MIEELLLRNYNVAVFIVSYTCTVHVIKQLYLDVYTEVSRLTTLPLNEGLINGTLKMEKSFSEIAGTERGYI